MFSPLEQFENHKLVQTTSSFFVNFFDTYIVSFTSFNIALFFALTFFFILTNIILSSIWIVPTILQNIFESFYTFVVGMIKSQTGSQGLVYFPYIFTVFLFIFSCNFMGLIPFSFTATAQLLLPLYLALSANIGFLVLTLQRQGVRIYKLFVPSGVSPYLIPLIAVIEVITYTLRSFSLSLRLFANMMAGHTLLFICAMLLTLAISISSILLFSVGYVLIVAVFTLEFVISFLQAYVFSVLLCVYLNDALNGGH